MADKIYRYVLDFKGKTDQITKDVGGLKGMLKGAAVAAGALFAADQIIGAARAVADYAKEISAVRDSVASLTGMQGAALNATTGQVQALATAYDQDVNETLKATNALMKTFGDTNTEVFDIMNRGFSGTANANDDFLKQVSEYSTHFKEAGLSASEMVAIISEGNQMGVFDDKSADAIKEAGIRLREMTNGTRDALNAIGLSADTIQQEMAAGNMSMFEVMQMVSRQLHDIPAQSPAVGMALADIFGGPGEDAVQFIRNLADVNTNLEEVRGQTSEVSEAQRRYAAELATFNTLGAQVFGGTSTLITNLKGIMIGWVNSAITGIVNVINYFIDLYNESVVFRGAIQSIKLVFQTVFDYIGYSFEQLLNYFRGAGNVIKAIFTGDWGSIGEIVRNTFTNIADSSIGFGQRTAENFNQAVANTLTPKEKVKAITLSSEDASAAGTAAGLAYATGFKTGTLQGAGRAAVPLLPGMTPIGATSVSGGTQPQIQQNAALIESNAALATSYEELGSTWGTAMSTIAQGVGDTAAGWLNFVAQIFQQIPVLLTQISALVAAQVAGSAAVVAAKEGEAMASAAAGAAKMPFPANLIAIGAAVAAIAAIWASIPKFEFGGLVPGNTFGGDRVLIRANSGEEVLTRDDPRHRNNYRQTAGNMGGMGLMVNFLQDGLVIDGNKLRILLKKEERMVSLRSLTV